MELHDALLQLAARIPSQLEHLKTEEATKAALVMPLINALGYNVFDPTEVIPEFIADVGVKKGEKVDYLLKHGGVAAILVECKHVGAPLTLENASQLFRYFAVTEARFAILNATDERNWSAPNAVYGNESIVAELPVHFEATFKYKF